MARLVRDGVDRNGDHVYATPDYRFFVVRRSNGTGWILMDRSGALPFPDSFMPNGWAGDVAVPSLRAARDRIDAVLAESPSS